MKHLMCASDEKGRKRQQSTYPYSVHVLREAVNAGHTASGACDADQPGYAMNHQSPQLL